MQAIKPLSAVDYALTAANFPFLKHAFTSDGISEDALSITCAIQPNTVATFPVGLDWEDTHVWRAGGSGGDANGTISGDPLYVLGTDDWMLISVGMFLTSGISVLMGNSTTGINTVPGVTGGANKQVLLTASDYHSIVTLSTATSLSAVAVTRTANTVAKYGVNLSDKAQASVAGVSAGAGIAGAWGALPGNITIPSAAGSWLSGIYLCSFSSGLPTAEDIKTALAWMAANPGKMYPSWHGKA